MTKLQGKERSVDTFRPGVKVALQATALIPDTKACWDREAQPRIHRQLGRQHGATHTEGGCVL